MVGTWVSFSGKERITIDVVYKLLMFREVECNEASELRGASLREAQCRSEVLTPSPMKCPQIKNDPVVK